MNKGIAVARGADGAMTQEVFAQELREVGDEGGRGSEEKIGEGEETNEKQRE